MKSKFLAGVAAIALAPASAMAVGLDRSNHDIGVLFEDGNFFELTYGRVMPDVTGVDTAAFGGQASGNVAEDFSQVGAGLKLQLTEQLSMAVIAGQPFGADISYPAGVPGSGGSLALGETTARLDSSELMALGRYEFSDNFSVHGGLRYVRLGEAEVTLSGAAYGPLNGYNVNFGEDSDIGYAVGAAYERPELALRVALTYFSKTEHDLPTVERNPIPPLGGGVPISSTTTTETPESVNLDFQTGLNQKTLLFGQIRYSWYDNVKLSPRTFVAAGQDSLTDIDNNYGVTLGVGRRLPDRLSGSLTLGFEAKGDSDFGSALAPTNGQRSIGLGLSYDVTDQLTLAGGVRYVDLGSALPDSGACGVVPGGCAEFEDNDVTAVGFSIGYSF